MNHIEIARAVEKLEPGTDVYDQMFKLKYIRVGEDFGNSILYVDSPYNRISQLTNAQRSWLKSKEAEGWTVEFNGRQFEAMRTPKNAQIVDSLLRS